MENRLIKRRRLNSPVVEQTPVIWKDRLVLVETWQTHYWDKPPGPHPYVRVRDDETNEVLCRLMDGYGMSSVRFICGTQDVHKALEEKISNFLGTQDTILYSSCFDANTGLFETILGEEDAIISDALNHASIIDGVRLSKAKRFRYANNDMADLENCLKQAASSRFRLIATDGVFSMDGIIADLKSICALAKQYDALVMFDDCHATGFLGKDGRGTHEYNDVMDQVDIITGTLGKALGGGMGGYISGKKTIR